MDKNQSYSTLVQYPQLDVNHEYPVLPVISSQIKPDDPYVRYKPRQLLQPKVLVRDLSTPHISVPTSNSQRTYDQAPSNQILSTLTNFSKGLNDAVNDMKVSKILVNDMKQSGEEVIEFQRKRVEQMTLKPNLPKQSFRNASHQHNQEIKSTLFSKKSLSLQPKNLHSVPSILDETTSIVLPSLDPKFKQVIPKIKLVSKEQRSNETGFIVKEDGTIVKPDVLHFIFEANELKRAERVFNQKISQYQTIPNRSEILKRQHGPLIGMLKKEKFGFLKSESFLDRLSNTRKASESNASRFLSPQPHHSSKLQSEFFLSPNTSVQQIESSLDPEKQKKMESYLQKLQSTIHESQQNLTKDILHESEKARKNMNTNQVKSKYLDFLESTSSHHKIDLKEPAENINKFNSRRNSMVTSRVESKLESEIKSPTFKIRRHEADNSNSLKNKFREFLAADPVTKLVLMQQLKDFLRKQVFEGIEQKFRDNQRKEFEQVPGIINQEEYQLQLISQMFAKQGQIRGLSHLSSIKQQNATFDHDLEREIQKYLQFVSGADDTLTQKAANDLVQQATDIPLPKVKTPLPIKRIGFVFQDHEKDSPCSPRSPQLPKQDKLWNSNVQQQQPKKQFDLGQGIQSMSENLVNKLEFGELMKQKRGSLKQEQKIVENPQYQLAKFLSQQTQLPKPILSAFDKQLTDLKLWKITLRSGQVKAIAETLKFMPQLELLLMHENNLCDSNLSILLASVNQNVPNLKTLTYRGQSNDLGAQGVDQILTLFQRGLPNQLRSLTLESIRLQPQAANTLFNSLDLALISTLSISDIKINRSNFKIICQKLPLMACLRSIEIKNIGSTALTNQELLAALLKCSIHDCNLSGMVLVDQNPDYFNDVNALTLPGEEHLHNENIYIPNDQTKDDKSYDSEEESEDGEGRRKVHWRQVCAVRSTQQYVLDKLFKLLREQKGLTHLDISNTGLSHSMVIEIAQMIRNENLQNLRSIHLNDDRQTSLENVDQSLIQELTEVLGLDADQVSEDLKGGSNGVSALPLDRNFLQMNKDLKEEMQIEQDFGAFQKRKDIFCLQRFMVRDVMQNSSWSIAQSGHCWVCNKSAYTLIDIVVEKEAKQCSVRFCDRVLGLKQQELEMKNMFNHLKDVDRIHIMVENLDKKFEQTMMENKTENEKILIKNQVSIGNLKRNVAKKTQWLGDWFRQRFAIQVRHHLLQRSAEFSDFQVFKFQNSQKDDKGIEQHKVVALMLKPGPHTFELVVDGQVTQYQLFVNPRKTKLENNQSDGYRKRVIQHFKRQKSELLDFKEDDTILLKLMLDHDQKHWKLSRLFKNDYDHQGVKRILLMHAKRLKDIFNQLSAQSKYYPQVHWIHFLTFCNVTGIISDGDYQFTEDDLSHCFITAVYDTSRYIPDCDLPKDLIGEKEKYIYRAKLYKQQMFFSKESLLSRHLFFEVLVRIALKKYNDQNLGTHALICQESLTQLIEVDLRQIDLRGPEEFRRNEICTSEIDMIFKANSVQLHALFNSLQDQELKCPTIKTTMQYLMQQGMTKLEARELYAFSKQTNIYDTKNMEKYQRVQYVEFLEILCRLARFKFQHQGSLRTQLMELLDTLLIKIGQRCQDPVWSLMIDQIDSGESD